MKPVVHFKIPLTSAFQFFTFSLQLFKSFKTLDTIPASKNVTF